MLQLLCSDPEIGDGKCRWVMSRKAVVVGHVLLTTWFFMRVALWLDSLRGWEYCGLECFPSWDVRLLLVSPIVLPVWLLVGVLLESAMKAGTQRFYFAVDLASLPVLYTISLLLNDSFG